MTIDEAKQIDICDFLNILGERCAKRKDSDSWYYCPGSNENTPSFHVHKYGTRWYDFREGKGGDIIDLAKHLFRLEDTRAALHAIANTMGHRYSCLPRKEKKGGKIAIASIMEYSISDLDSRLLMYSRGRGIHDEIILKFCKQINFRTHTGKNLYAIGFGNDRGGWEVRNPFYKGCIGNKAITSMIDMEGPPIVVCEGFFDYLSLLELGWIDIASHNAVVLNSTSLVDTAISFFFSRPIITCLDNDKSGKLATQKIKEACNVVEDWSARFPQHIDVNEFLMR